MKRLLFPAAASLALVVSATLGTKPAFAEQQQHCNNKVCEWLELSTCQQQSGGPDTHCIESGPVCAWDLC